MSYSRWGSSLWYTYWCGSKSTERKDQIFEVCGLCSITYGDMERKGLDDAISRVKEFAEAEYCADALSAEGIYDELRVYMQRFMSDVIRDKGITEERKFAGAFVTLFNDTPVYEGDIVKYVSMFTHGPHESGTGEVFYDEESGSFLIDRDCKYTFGEITGLTKDKK